jgi:hypothetical protein
VSARLHAQDNHPVLASGVIDMHKQQNTSNQQQSTKPAQPNNPMSGKPAQPTPQKSGQPAQTGTGPKK